MGIADSLGKALMLGKTEGRRRRGWQRMRWLDGIIDSMDVECEQTPGVGDGQGSLTCCSSWGHRVRRDLATEQQDNNLDLAHLHFPCILLITASHKASHDSRSKKIDQLPLEGRNCKVRYPTVWLQRVTENWGCFAINIPHQVSCIIIYHPFFFLVQFSSVANLCLTLRPHWLQHARLPCPSTMSGACSNSCPLSRWCHPTTSFSVVPFSSCLQSFTASGSFPRFSSSHQVAKVLELKLQPQSFQWLFRTDFV